MGFDFINLLWGIPAIAALLLIPYLIKGRRERTVVSSLFILKKLLAAPSSKRVINFRKRYFFDLLILSLILLGAAGLFLSNRLHTIFLIDNSFSMHIDNGSGATPFAQALEKARDKISKEGVFSNYQIYLSSPSLTKIEGINQLDAANPDSDDLLSVEERSLQSAVYSPDQIDRIIENLRKDFPGSRIAVFTDKSAGDKTVTYGQNNIFINTTDRGNSGGNLYFTSVLVDELSKRLSLQVKNGNAGSGEIQVECDQAVSAGSSIEYQNFYRKSIKIEGVGILNIEVSGLPQSAEGGKCTLRAVKNSLADFTAADNQVFFSFENSSRNILMVSSYEPSLLGIEKLGKNIVVENALNNNPGKDSAYAGIIYHQLLPASLPRKPFLIINPPAGNELIKSKTIEGANLKISSWQGLNPILQYLNLSSLEIRKTGLLTVPEWGYPVLGIEQGNILFSGMANGVRGAVSGLELLPFQGKDNLPISILTLNLISWVFEGSLAGQYIAPYKDSLSWQSNNETGKNITAIKFSDGNAGKPVGKDFTPDRPGLISTTTSTGIQRFIAVNYLDEQESAAESTAIQINPNSLHQLPVSGLKQDNGSYPLYKELAIGIIIILLLDLLLLSRKKKYV